MPSGPIVHKLEKDAQGVRVCANCHIPAIWHKQHLNWICPIAKREQHGDYKAYKARKVSEKLAPKAPL